MPRKPYTVTVRGPIPADLGERVAQAHAQAIAAQRRGWEYPAAIPKAVPEGKVLVHNHVRPARRQGTRGFRFWLQAPTARVEACDCGWAPEHAAQYRVVRR